MARAQASSPGRRKNTLDMIRRSMTYRSQLQRPVRMHTCRHDDVYNIIMYTRIRIPRPHWQLQRSLTAATASAQP